MTSLRSIVPLVVLLRMVRLPVVVLPPRVAPLPLVAVSQPTASSREVVIDAEVLDMRSR